MRTIGVVACHALVIVLTLLVPVSAQVFEFTPIDGLDPVAHAGLTPDGAAGLGASDGCESVEAVYLNTREETRASVTNRLFEVMDLVRLPIESEAEKAA